jgi:hypothetical protein
MTRSVVVVILTGACDPKDLTRRRLFAPLRMTRSVVVVILRRACDPKDLTRGVILRGATTKDQHDGH